MRTPKAATKPNHVIVKWNATTQFEPHTIAEHAKLLQQSDPASAHVWWAKISKSGRIGMPPAQTRLLTRQLRDGVETHLYIYGPDQPRPTLHIGRLVDLATQRPPDDDHIPAYYSTLAYPKPFWFRLTDIRQLSLEHLSNLETIDGAHFDPVSANAYPLLVRERVALHPFDYSDTGGVPYFQLQRLSVAGQEVLDVDPRFVFVLMPFTKEFEDAWTLAIRPAAEEQGFACRRADDFMHTRDIMEVVRENIRRAGLIIADMTHNNPNVFYELGFAHACGKPVILITRERMAVPFDLRSVQNIEYSTATDLKLGLTRVLQAMRR
jgi:hypothetical protein